MSQRRTTFKIPGNAALAWALASLFTGIAIAPTHVRAQMIIRGQDNVVVPTAIDDHMKPTTTDEEPPAGAAPPPEGAQEPDTPAPKPTAKASPAEKPEPAVKAKPAPAKKAKAPVKEAAIPAPRTARPSANENSIVALVNDEPITGYEVSQRAQMLAGGDVAAKAQEKFKALIKDPSVNERLKAILQQTIKENQSKSKDEILAIFERRKKEFAMGLQKQAIDSARSSTLPALRKKALDELIDERLKMQEAKRVGAVASDSEIDRIIEGIAQRNKVTTDQMAQQFGGSLEPMKYRVRSTLAWNEVIRRKFGRDVSVATRDIEKYVSSSTADGDDQVELQIQRIRIAVPAKLDQGGVAKQVSEAESIRAKFTDCKTASQTANGVPGAAFEDLGKRRPSVFPEPTRTMLLNAKDGEMLPPQVEGDAVNLFIVCGRDVIKADDQKRTAAEGELKQKELEILARRHLKDLRQDAHIEYR